MDKVEFGELMAHMDIVELMIREKESEEFIEKGQYEDAIAYAMAAGTRLGWDAHKRKMAQEDQVKKERG